MENAVYIAIGIRLDGTKEVMGMYRGGNESAEYWLGVLNDLKARGVQEILVCCVNGLSGFCDDIASVYPWTDVQRCINPSDICGFERHQELRLRSQEDLQGKYAGGCMAVA